MDGVNNPDLDVILKPLEPGNFGEVRLFPVQPLYRDYQNETFEFKLNYMAPRYLQNPNSLPSYQDGFVFQLTGVPADFDVNKFVSTLSDKVKDPWFQGRLSSVRSHLEFGYFDGQPISEEHEAIAKRDMIDVLTSINRIYNAQYCQSHKVVHEHEMSKSQSTAITHESSNHFSIQPSTPNIPSYVPEIQSQESIDEAKTHPWLLKRTFWRSDMDKPEVKFEGFDTYKSAVNAIHGCHSAMIQVWGDEVKRDYLDSVTTGFYNSLAQGSPAFDIQGDFMDPHNRYLKFRQQVVVIDNSRRLQNDTPDVVVDRPVHGDSLKHLR